MFLGVKVVLAKSFQRIHTDNLVNFGILPLQFKNEADYGKIDQGDELEISNVTDALKKGGPIVIRDVTKNVEIPVEYTLSERQREIILAGGSLSYAKQQMNK
jgi:aconitate hydratase